MTPSVPQFVTDEQQGRNDFVNTLLVEGDLISVEIARNNNRVASGQKQGTMRCAALFKFGNITELKRADGTEPDSTEWTVRYDYSEWDSSNARPLNPERRGDWFEFVVPAFAEAGIDLNDPLNDETGIEVRINKAWRFELKEFERNYKVPVRDPGTNEIIFHEEGSDGEADAIANEEKPEDNGRMPVRVPATYSNLFPVVVPSAGSTEDEVLEYAAKLWADHNAGSSDDNLEAFKAAAIDDPLIGQNMTVRKAIQSGKYTLPTE